MNYFQFTVKITFKNKNDLKEKKNKKEELKVNLCFQLFSDFCSHFHC